MALALLDRLFLNLNLSAGVRAAERTGAAYKQQEGPDPGCPERAARVLGSPIILSDQRQDYILKSGVWDASPVRPLPIHSLQLEGCQCVAARR
jgi:hypothetical protein